MLAITFNEVFALESGIVIFPFKITFQKKIHVIEINTRITCNVQVKILMENLFCILA